MKNLVVLIFIYSFLQYSNAQEYEILFEPKEDTISIDSIHAENLTKGLTVKLNSGETLRLVHVTSGIEDLLKSSESVFLYPNPFAGSSMFCFSIEQRQDVRVHVFDASGKSILMHQKNLLPGKHWYNLRLRNPGLYHVVVFKNNLPINMKAVYNGVISQNAELNYLGADNSFVDPVKSVQLKNAEAEKTLYYSEGDVIHYTVYSEENVTVISDTPNSSKTIEIEFCTCKDNDGRNYKTVKIGEQVWMAENLAYLPSVSPSVKISLTTPCYYVCGYEENDVQTAKTTLSYKTCGALYNWPAAISSCSEGWHLPSDDEWKQLELALGMAQNKVDAIGWRGTDQGAQLKTTDGWYNDQNGTNSAGFSALPGGANYLGSCNDYKYQSYWWSSTEYFSSFAWRRKLQFNLASVDRSPEPKNYGFSVRCVRD